ncbi:amino acid permease-associated protein [Candidatus Protochlamydia naegleriophila]|uniref:Amino acid permease-associated protein n=1 Tax=Candidatus Protochlamydia naegleriophila TaxID=389348 RepID=A0A0U5EPS1_9BACT|nr:amino acid permease [Candidatus Protochlamydia naegleriophila]CUI16080.1 amino acid permease-associated protein [Candidatus Protochlamydia naegleriophila]
MSLWRTKSLEFLTEEANSGDQKLERKLGAFSLILLGVGAIIGAGLFSITGIAAAENAGPAIVLSFLLASLGCVFAGLCFSELAAMIPVAGGAYSYTYATLGEFVAWIIGWALILEYAAGAAVVSISWSAYVVSFLQGLNIHLPTALLASPWQPTHLPDGTEVYGWINLPPLLIIALLSGLLIVGIDKSAKVNAILVAIKVAVVLLFIGVGFGYVQEDNYKPFIPPNTGGFGEFGWSGIMRAAGVVFLAYIGFDAVSTAAQEVKRPQRNLPIGIIGSLGICTVLYVLFALVLVGLVHYTELNVAAPVAAAINKTPFLWLNGLIKLAIIAGLTSVILVLLLGQSRIFFTMSKDGLLPPFFSIVHPRYHTPWVSSLFLMVLVGLFAAFAPLSLVGHLTSIGTLLAFAIVCVSVIVLRKTHPDWERPFKTPFVPLIPLFGILTCMVLMFSLGWASWARLAVWILIGLAVYFLYGKQNSHLAKFE